MHSGRSCWWQKQGERHIENLNGRIGMEVYLKKKAQKGAEPAADAIPCVLDLVKAESEGVGFRGHKSVPVLRRKREIMAALAAGYPRKLVWKVMVRNHMISLSYDRFLVLCREHGMGPGRPAAPERGAERRRGAKGYEMGRSSQVSRPWEPNLKEIYGAEDE